MIQGASSVWMHPRVLLRLPPYLKFFGTFSTGISVRAIGAPFLSEVELAAVSGASSKATGYHSVTTTSNSLIVIH